MAKKTGRFAIIGADMFDVVNTIGGVAKVVSRPFGEMLSAA